MTLNYVHALDTLGSTFKVIADCTNKHVEGDNDYHTSFIRNGKTSDSVHRNNTSSHYRIYTADGVLSKQLSPRTKLVAGVKYTHNDMSNTVRYESLLPSGWHPLPAYHYSLGYTEHIGAVYGTFSAEYNRLSLVAGLRGEYTHANGHHHRIRQSYFDLFPNLNVTYSFDPMRTFMLIGQYSRNIERPNFRRLHPNRIQYSEYSYYIGNRSDGRLPLSLCAFDRRQPAPRSGEGSAEDGDVRPERYVHHPRKSSYGKSLLCSAERPFPSDEMVGHEC